MTNFIEFACGAKNLVSTEVEDEDRPEFLLPKAISEQVGFQSAGRDPVLTALTHELKTPIAIISGYIEILLDAKLGPVNEDQRRILADSAENCRRLKKSVEGILSQASYDRQAEIHLEPGDFNHCLTDACSYWKDPFQAKGVVLYLQADPKLEPFLFDYEKIQRVVSNLLDNALKFTPPQGSVWLTIQHARLEGGRDGRCGNVQGNTHGMPDSVPAIKVTVADTGPGIPDEYRAEIFQEFFRIPNQLVNPDGTGLGLSIARHLVQAHGGRIWAESERGTGARICFLVPVRQNSELAHNYSGGGTL